MQLVNHAPVAHPEPVCITALKLREVVVRRIVIRRNLPDLRHNPLLPVRRELGDGLVEGFCGDDRVHSLLLLPVTLSVKHYIKSVPESVRVAVESLDHLLKNVPADSEKPFN